MQETEGDAASDKHDDWEDMKKCDDFIENTSGGEQTVLVAIHNSGTFPLDVDIGGTDQGKAIPPGKTRVKIVTLKPGESLHAGGEGKWNPDVKIS